MDRRPPNKEDLNEDKRPKLYKDNNEEKKGIILYGDYYPWTSEALEVK